MRAPIISDSEIKDIISRRANQGMKYLNLAGFILFTRGNWSWLSECRASCAGYLYP